MDDSSEEFGSTTGELDSTWPATGHWRGIGESFGRVTMVGAHLPLYDIARKLDNLVVAMERALEAENLDLDLDHDRLDRDSYTRAEMNRELTTAFHILAASAVAVRHVADTVVEIFPT